MRHLLLEHRRVVRLQALVAPVARQAGEELVLDHLLGDRAGPLRVGASLEKFDSSARAEAAEVDTVVRVELLVLDRQERSSTSGGTWRERDRLAVLASRTRRSRCRRRRRRSVRCDSDWNSGSDDRQSPRGRWRSATRCAGRRRSDAGGQQGAGDDDRDQTESQASDARARQASSARAVGGRHARRVRAMTAQRPFRFGVQASTAADVGGVGRRSPARAEALGYDVSRCPTTSATSSRRCRR